MNDDKVRLRRVFAHLRGLCATKEAIDSLEAFQSKWAFSEQGRELGFTPARGVYGGGNRGGGSGGKKVKERRGVFEMLTGRKK